MKHSLWRLISSFYILLISGLMVIISAYAWMVISKAPGVNGPNIGISMPNIPKVVYDTVTSTLNDSDLIDKVEKRTLDDGTVEYQIKTAEDFVVVMRAIDDGLISGKAALRLLSHISLETTAYWNANQWKGVYLNDLNNTSDVSSSSGFNDINANETEDNPIKKVSIYADDSLKAKDQTAYIRGLTDALFRGGDSKIASIELRDITIIAAEIYSEDPTGGGAFISIADNMPSVLIKNCHLLNSTVTSALNTKTESYARVGGIVGYSRALMMRIEDCTVSGSRLIGSSVGGIIGHSSANEGKCTVIAGGKVFNTEMQSLDSGSWRVGEIVGTINAGYTVIADPEYSQNTLSQIDKETPSDTLYGRLSLGSTGAINIVNTERNTVDVFERFVQEAADCFTANTPWQTWNIHGTVKMYDEIRFQGNHVDIVGQNGAVIELLGTSTISGTAMGQADSPAGFNFGQIGENTATFQQNSSVKFTDIQFKNTKALSVNSKDLSHYYMYANARTVIYSNCDFDRGVLVFGSASFQNCNITENTAKRYCVIAVGDHSDMTLSIANSEFHAGNTAAGCVFVDGNRRIFTLNNSDFYNETEIPAVYVNGRMHITTDGQNFFTSETGGILTAQKDSCTFNGEGFYCPTAEDYLNADILTKAKLDRTEHGNNSLQTREPDEGIGYDGLLEEIPETVLPESDIADPKTYIIDSAEKFIAVMNMLNQKDESGASLLSGNYRIVLTAHIDISAYDFESVNINDTANTLGTITIEADPQIPGASTAFIKGLSKPLFGEIFSESASVSLVLEDLTIIGSTMTLDTKEYSNAGTFISKAYFKKGSVFIRNCHSLNNAIVSTEPDTENSYSRIGGIIGYTIMPSVWVEDCTVRGCTLTGASVGGIIGHSSASKSNETYIVNCFVENTTITCIEENADWRVGEIIGTANIGGNIVVNPMVLENRLVQEGVTDSHLENDPYKALYGRFKLSSLGDGKLIFVDTKTNPELHTALVYGSIDPNATQFLTSEKQLWLVFDSARVSEEIRFTGSDITLQAYSDSGKATLLLNSAAKSGSGKGLAASASGFNFGTVGQYTTSYKSDSVIRFMNLTIQNQKTYYKTSVPSSNDRSYTYAYAEHVYYTNCAFEGGVVVYANAAFEGCSFKTLQKDDLCLLFTDEDGLSYQGSIQNCTFAAQDAATACVIVNGIRTLAIENSEFTNDTVYPAVSLHGQTTMVTTDQKNIFYSESGGILALAEGSFLNGNPCPTKSEYEEADQLTKAEYDKTENGNNGGAKDPDRGITYSEIGSGNAEIPKDEATGAYLIQTADQFVAVMQMLNETTDFSQDITIILRGHFDLTNSDFESVKIKSSAMGTLTIKADTEFLGTSTAFIKGLNAPLFDYVEAATGAVVLQDITIIDSKMNPATKDVNTSAESKYANNGIFMSSALLTKGSVSIINCHAINTEITCAPNAQKENSRLGGIIGYTNSAEVLIQDCSVRGCKLTGASTGGIVGHASASQGRKTNIVDCFVENTVICCTEENADWRVGEMIGTANQGQITVSNPMVSGNTLEQNAEKPESDEPDSYRTLYGRYKPAKAGGSKLIFINQQGESYEVSA